MTNADLQIQPIIGMEIHVQLATRTKLLCGCAVEFGADPNERTCPVCLALPGALPVLNQHAIELAVQTGLALGCRVDAFSQWDRKSYFYPDLPKNFQTSQYQHPVCGPGEFTFDVAGQTHSVRIRRAHLEEDAGKSIHDQPGGTLVDLNRAGTPLLEIVTEPDLHGAEDAYAFATELHRLVTYLGASEANMEQGQMRFEPNVNVAIARGGETFHTPIAEIKNLNSFRSIRAAVEFEVHRQVADWQCDNEYVRGKRPNENRGWSDQRGATELQRVKEAEQDYRYFPDPDLVPVELTAETLESWRAALPELPRIRRRRWIDQLSVAPAAVDIILADRPTADLFDAAVEHAVPADVLAGHFVNIWAPLAGDRNATPANLGIDAQRIAKLASMVAGGTISATAAKQIAAAMLDSPHAPDALAETLGLVMVADQVQLQQWVDQAMADNPDAVKNILTNPKKAQAGEGFLRGQVMRLSAGKADARAAGEIIANRINELRTTRETT